MLRTAVGYTLPATQVELAEFYARLARAKTTLDRAYDFLKPLVRTGKTVAAALDDGDVPSGTLALACQHFGLNLDDLKLLAWYAGHKAEVDADPRRG